jgi:ferric-dicitrate binding protein FerR (iron transport regulator)
VSTTDFTVEKLTSDDSFRAWAEGRADIEEKKQWDQWVQKSDKNRRLARRAQSQIIGFSFRPLAKPQTGRAWKRLAARIAAGRTRQHRIPTVPRPRRYWYGAAASILVIITAGLIGLFMYTPPQQKPVQPAWKEAHTTYGEHQKIALSTGSVIVLGAHSTLKYQANPPVGRPMRVKLKGKAYFSSGNQSQPGDTVFTIQTSAGRIFDIGTQFVVSSRAGHTRVILKRGKVGITRKSKSGKKSVLLQPNQMAAFSKGTSGIHIKTVNSAVFTSWTTDKLIFDHTPLTAFAGRLRYTFGKPVVVCGSRLRHRSLSGSVRNGKLKVIVGAVAKALHTSYTIKADTVYLGKCK